MIDQFSFDFTQAITPADKFEEYHRLNPQVCSALEQMARDLINKGRRKVGIKMLMEVLRWNYQMKTEDNNYAPYYARLLIERNPQWADVFELRAIRSY